MSADKFPPLELPSTISSLRELYRSSEARSARLKVLIETGRDLATANSENLASVLDVSAQRAAHFVGCRSGVVSRDINQQGVKLFAPASGGQALGTLILNGWEDVSKIINIEDKDTLNLLAQLMAAAIERVEREVERNQLLSTLQERERRLEHVVERLFRAQEDERRRVSAELHDGVAQTASALFRRLESRYLNQKKPSLEDQTLVEITRSMVKELRRVIGGLRPTALDDLGLPAALSGLADGLRSDGFDVELRERGQEPWPPVLATAFFRIGQEAISNIRKHSGRVCRVEIDLSTVDVDGAWQLRIQDFGNGFSEVDHHGSAAGEHVGIEIMQERILAVGGTLTVKSEPGNGVLIFATVPHTASQ